jgi:hypothetical protein
MLLLFSNPVLRQTRTRFVCLPNLLSSSFNSIESTEKQGLCSGPQQQQEQKQHDTPAVTKRQLLQFIVDRTWHASDPDLDKRRRALALQLVRCSADSLSNAMTLCTRQHAAALSLALVPTVNMPSNLTHSL